MILRVTICFNLFFLLFTSAVNAQQYQGKGQIKLKGDFHKNISYSLRNNRMIIKIYIGNKSCNFIVDTDAPLCISQNLQHLFRFDTLATQQFIDESGNRDKSVIVETKNIYMGGIPFEGFPALIQDFRNKFFRCDSIEGIMGVDILRFLCIRFNSNNKKMEISNDINAYSLSGFSKSPLILDRQGIPSLVSYLNKVPDTAIFDTGAQESYIIGRNFRSKIIKNNLRKFRILAVKKGIYTSTYKVNQPDTEYVYSLDSLCISAHCHPSSIVQSTFFHQSRIGQKFLEDKDIILDFPNRNFYIKENQKNKLIPFSTFGFDFYIKNNQTYISYVWENSEAANQGLLPGLQIISVNGLSVLDYCKSAAALNLMMQKENHLKLGVAVGEETKTIEVNKNRFQ